MRTEQLKASTAYLTSDLSWMIWLAYSSEPDRTRVPARAPRNHRPADRKQHSSYWCESCEGSPDRDPFPSCIPDVSESRDRAQRVPGTSAAEHDLRSRCRSRPPSS